MSNLQKAMEMYFVKSVKGNAPALYPGIETDRESLCSGNNYNKQFQKESSIFNEKNNTNQDVSLPIVRIDTIKRNSKGKLLSNDMKQQEKEYQNIKRPLLHNAFRKESTLVKDGNLVMITSAIAEEGKSFLTLNLALSIARELDRTVLLIDADVYRQGVSRMLGIGNYKGLTDILSNNTLGITDVLIRSDIPRLKFLPAGQTYPNIAELLASENMRRLTAEMAKRYSDRLILFDAPPVLATSEARVLAGLVGQILLVVEAERTTQFMVQEAISCLDSAKAIGLVLNKSRRKSSSAYRYGY